MIDETLFFQNDVVVEPSLFHCMEFIHNLIFA